MYQDLTSAECVLASRVADDHDLAGEFDGWVATLLVTFPRVVLAERATHRILSCGTEFVEVAPTSGEWLSKNSSSSRAMPITKVIEAVMETPYVPDRAGMAYAKGMGGVEMGEVEYKSHVRNWLYARDKCVDMAEIMAAGGCSKQVVNRLLEPWMWVPQLLTATGAGWANFLALRLDSGADPAMQKLAGCVRNVLASESKWQVLADDRWWHVPFVGTVRWNADLWPNRLASLPEQFRVSAARCAWLSYENWDKSVEGTTAVERTWSKLIESAPVHASPTEHQVRCPDSDYDRRQVGGNLRPWQQLRSFLPGESIRTFDGIGPNWSEI